MSTENREEGLPLTYQSSVEETLARAKEERDRATLKAKKRKKILIIVGVVLLALIIAIAIIIFAVSKLTPPMVSTISPTRGDIEANVMVSGALESDKNVQYTVPAAVLVDSIVGSGEAVSKGDTLVKFNQEDFERVLREFELENMIAKNTYQSQLTDFEKNKKDLSTANANASKYRKLRDQQQKTVDSLTAGITDANAVRAAQIEVEIYECQKKIDDYTYCIQNAEMLGMGKEGIEAYTRYIHSESQKIAALQFELSQLSNSVVALEQQKTLSDAQKLLADYETELATAEAEQDTLKGIVGNEYDEQNLYLNGELSLMRAEKSYEDILKYQGGLKSEFSGVVLNVAAKPGETTVPGSVLVTIASTEMVKIRFDINKYDMLKLQVGQKADVMVLDKEYTGTVSKVNRVAVMSDAGTSSLSAEVTIDNPDREIYLGMEAKVTIHTARKDDVIMLPLQVVNSDSDGDFVYVVEDGIIVKKYLTLGISSDEYIEVVNGISEDATVVSTITIDVVEGKRMLPVPDMMLQMQMDPTMGMEMDVDAENASDTQEDDQNASDIESGVSEDAALPKEEDE